MADGLAPMGTRGGGSGRGLEVGCCPGEEVAGGFGFEECPGGLFAGVVVRYVVRDVCCMKYVFVSPGAEFCTAVGLG